MKIAASSIDHIGCVLLYAGSGTIDGHVGRYWMAVWHLERKLLQQCGHEQKYIGSCHHFAHATSLADAKWIVSVGYHDFAIANKTFRMEFTQVQVRMWPHRFLQAHAIEAGDQHCVLRE